jgi:hypothetical protein
MKKFVEKLLRNYAMVVIIAGTTVFLSGSETFPISGLRELLAILFLAELLALLIDKLVSNSKYPILEHLLKIITTTTAFLIGRWIFGWHEAITIWFIIIAVAMVYVIECFLDLRKASQDIAYINEQLKQRRDKKKEHTK